MNQGKYIFFGILLIIVAVIIYWVIKTIPQDKTVESSQVVIDNDKQIDSLTKTSSAGKMLYQEHCASCHSIFRDMTGPALFGVSERWLDKKKLYQFIKNPTPFFKNNKYVKELVKKFEVLTPGFDLTNEQIDAILTYIETEAVQTQY